MARIIVHVDSSALVREVAALGQLAESSPLVRSELRALTERGVAMVEIVSDPAVRGEPPRVRRQLADAYWRILEGEAV